MIIILGLIGTRITINNEIGKFWEMSSLLKQTLLKNIYCYPNRYSEDIANYFKVSESYVLKKIFKDENY